MIIEFTHPELGQEVRARAGYYVPLEERLLPYGDREVLYIVGQGCIEASCCAGTGSWGYVQAPGFLVKKGPPIGSAPAVSEIEIIEDRQARREIRQSLLKRHPGAQVEIWDTMYASSTRPR